MLDAGGDRNLHTDRLRSLPQDDIHTRTILASVFDRRSPAALLGKPFHQVLEVLVFLAATTEAGS